MYKYKYALLKIFAKFFYLRIAGQKVFRVVVVVVVVLLVRKDFKKLDKNKLALKNVFGFLFNHDQN